MEEIVLPFKLSKDAYTKAVSEVTFTVQRNVSEFRNVSIARMRFMDVYEQERHNMTNYPLRNRAWFDYKSDTDAYRDSIAEGLVDQRNDIAFGHARTPHLKALDLLPHWIEIEVLRQGQRNDRSTITTSTQMEHQSVDPRYEQIKEDNTKMQSLLIYNTNLVRGEYGGWEGVISCDMTNLGFVRLNRGSGTTFTIRASMYNYMRQGLGEMPSIQLSLLFR